MHLVCQRQKREAVIRSSLPHEEAARDAGLPLEEEVKRGATPVVGVSYIGAGAEEQVDEVGPTILRCDVERSTSIIGMGPIRNGALSKQLLECCHLATGDRTIQPSR